MAKNKLLGGMEGAFSHDMKDIVNHNFTDVSLCTTEFDAVTGTTGATLTNVVGMVTDTLEAGNYKFKIHVPCVATANTGIKMAFKWGTAASISVAQYSSRAFTASGVAVTNGTTATDQTLLLDSAAGVVILGEIEGTFTVTIPTTLQFQAAQHTAHADTVSVYVGAKLEVTRMATN